MRLHEETVGIQGQLEELGDLLRDRMGPDGRGQGQVVRLELDGNLEVLVKDRDQGPLTVGGHLRRALRLKADELHPQIPGFFVVNLL